MGIRFAAASALALAAALTVAPARAQNFFFSFYEMSPRQIVGMLQDDGYQLRGPMIRRGDVYVCNVTSVSGRSLRLIVSAHDGRVLERFAESPRWRGWSDGDDGASPRNPRPPRDVGQNDNRDTDQGDSPRHGDMALGDLFNPPTRVYGNDSLSPSKPEPSAEPTPAAKSLHHHVAKRKHEPSLAKAPAASPTPGDGGKPDSSVAAVAPNAPGPGATPAEAAKPVEPVKPEAAPSPSPGPVQKKAEVEKHPSGAATPAPKPKAETPRKKINDLPVGTLD